MLIKCGVCESEAASGGSVKISGRQQPFKAEYPLENCGYHLVSGGNSRVFERDMLLLRFVPLLLLSVNFEDLRGWIQCLYEIPI